jgi:hypothetical protein
MKRVALILALSACAPVAPPVFVGPVPDTCNSAAQARLIGKSGAAIAAAGLAQPVRVVPLGGRMTEDYGATRINFMLDGAGRVARITCG